jgi:hypothetical protein
MAMKKKSTGRSADAMAGAAAAKKAAARAKATGQTKQSSMDAVSRRYKPTALLGKDEKNNTILAKTVRDKVTGGLNRGPKGVNSLSITTVAKASAKKKRPSLKNRTFNNK